MSISVAGDMYAIISGEERNAVERTKRQRLIQLGRLRGVPVRFVPAGAPYRVLQAARPERASASRRARLRIAPRAGTV